MRYSPRGSLVAGVAGGVVSIDRAAVGRGGGTRWRDDDAALANAQDAAGTYGLDQFDRAAGWQERRLDDRGATRIAAGGGNYAVTVQSRPPETYGEIAGAPLPAALAALFVLEGSPDGALVFCTTDYLTLVARWADGVVDRFMVGSHVNFDSVRLGPDWLLYMEEPRTLWFQERGKARRAIPVADTPFEPDTFQGPNGTRWFLYHNNRTYLQQESTRAGYMFDASYGPAAYVDGAGLCHVALTASAGELPETIVLAPPFQLGANVQAFDPPAVVPAVPRLNHRVSIVPFKDPFAKTRADSEVVVNAAMPVSQRPRWVASDPATIVAFRKGTDHGLYTETFDAAELRVVITLAASLNTRVAFCHDGTDLDRELVKLLRPCDQVWLECYRVKTETLAQSRARWSDNLDVLLSLWGHEVGLIPQDYTQGGAPPDETWTVQEALDACETIPALANRSARIVVIAPFEYLRANGASAHMELAEWLDRLTQATPGVPTFAAVEPTPPHPADPPVDPQPPTEEPHMQLPARCFALLHNGNIASVPAGTNVVELAHDPQEYGGWQAIEVTKSKDWSPTNPAVLVRFVDANRLLRVDKVLAQQRKYDECLLTWDPAAADADSVWQQFLAAGPYLHATSDSPDGKRHGVVYTIACVDKDGKLFQ